jgi:hypothetical protein
MLPKKPVLGQITKFSAALWRGQNLKNKKKVYRYQIEKDLPISSAELKATEIATNFMFQQDEQKAIITCSLTRERHAKY